MRPTVHGVAADAPTAGQYPPAVHAAQALRAVVAPNVPTAHRAQAERPVVAPNVPVAHAIDAVPAPPHAPVVPLALDGAVPGQYHLKRVER